jgi:hypothetical protein
MVPLAHSVAMSAGLVWGLFRLPDLLILAAFMILTTIGSFILLILIAPRLDLNFFPKGIWVALTLPPLTILFVVLLAAVGLGAILHALISFLFRNGS